MPKKRNLFSEPCFHDEAEARAWFERARWPKGTVHCPHCGTLEPYPNKSKVGVYRCRSKECRKDFTVTTGTVMERSHMKLTQWAMGFYLAASSKKGFSALQLHRALGCQYNSAWFMHHRIMEAMRRGDLDPMGGEGKIVEVDETYYGPVSTPKVSRQRKGRAFTKHGKMGPGQKRVILSLVERGGAVRSFHIPNADANTVRKIVTDNIAKESRLHTDESRLYHGAEKHFAAHETVNHSKKEYAREDVHVNTAEGYFGVFKRGMRGVYQHCAEKHLHRYLAEFDFRFNHREALGYTDAARTTLAIRSAVGKRLTYYQPDQA